MSLGQYIKDNIKIASYLDKELTRPAWRSTPFWLDEPMKVYKPLCNDHCRFLFTFNIGSKRYMLKIDEHPDFLQCEHEILVWSRIQKVHKKYFVPIMCGAVPNDGPPWIVCPFVPNLTLQESTCEQEQIINDLEATYELYDLRFNSNWFIYNGRPLIVDYGVQRGW